MANKILIFIFGMGVSYLLAFSVSSDDYRESKRRKCDSVVEVNEALYKNLLKANDRILEARIIIINDSLRLLK